MNRKRRQKKSAGMSKSTYKDSLTEGYDTSEDERVIFVGQQIVFPNNLFNTLKMYQKIK